MKAKELQEGHEIGPNMIVELVEERAGGEYVNVTLCSGHVLMVPADREYEV